MTNRLSQIAATGVLVFSVGVAPYFAPDYSYAGERMQRFKQKAREIYNKATRLDPKSSTPEERARTGRIAGEMLEKATGIPGIKKGAEWINRKNESEGFYEQQKKDRIEGPKRVRDFNPFRRK